MEEYWSHSSEAESSCHQFSEDSWTYNSSSPIQNSADTFDITSCMAQSNYDFQNKSYQDRFHVYNQAYYANSFSSEIEEKTEMFEDSGSKVEVQSKCKTGRTRRKCQLQIKFTTYKRRNANHYNFRFIKILL